MTARVFENQKKLRNAEFIMPPNVLKQKMGSGGIDPGLLVKAQEKLENNAVDFKPIAMELIRQLKAAIENGKSRAMADEAMIDAMIRPAMQLKAQGAMFHFPLITDISDTLVSFLETVVGIDKDVLEIVVAHQMAISVVLGANMQGAVDAKGKELRDSLVEACMRYYKAREAV